MLSKRHCDEFLDMFTTIHAMRLRHVYNAERDGISILCQSYLHGEQHAFRITSPQIADDPHHVMLISSLIHIAQQEILKIEIHEYLATLDRYLK